MRLFLNVPYSDKDEVKSLDAKWDPIIKKWYVEYPQDKYIKFSKWILKDSDEAIIAHEYLHIIEGHHQCWKCKKQTKIVGLGIGEFTRIYNTDNGTKYDYFESMIDSGEEIHLAWVDNQNFIPPKILKYLKLNYSLKNTSLNSFANCCVHCNAIQGNWFLFDEPSSPLSSCSSDSILKQRMKKLTIYSIPIEDDLQVDWNIQLCSNDFAYLKYGTNKELILSSDPNNDYISYQELYEI